MERDLLDKMFIHSFEQQVFKIKSNKTKYMTFESKFY